MKLFKIFFLNFSSILFLNSTVFSQPADTTVINNTINERAVSTETAEKQINDKPKIPRLPIFGLGAGLMTFYGDVKEKNIGDPNSFRFGFNFSITQPLSQSLGFGLSVLYGKLAGNQMLTNRNFETKLTNVGLNIIYSFDNNVILKNSVKAAPYLFAGPHFNLLKTSSDLKDKDGKTYNYWSDGTIRNLPEADNVKTDTLQRDYVYESSLIPSHSAISFPIGVGIKFRISNQFSANISAEYHFTLSDKIDAFEDGIVDKYSFASVSVHYNLYKPKEAIDETELKFMQVDFLTLDSKDSDDDGVIDFKDICPNTSKGILVDRFGCPLDDDKDGIPNYRDKQANTRKGTMVDVNGVELTGKESPEVLAKYLKPDSLALSNLSSMGIYVISNMAAGDTISIKNVGSKEIIYNSKITFNDQIIIPQLESTNPYFIITNATKNETWLVSNFKSGDTLSVTSIYDEKFKEVREESTYSSSPKETVVAAKSSTDTKQLEPTAIVQSNENSNAKNSETTNSNQPISEPDTTSQKQQESEVQNNPFESESNKSKQEQPVNSDVKNIETESKNITVQNEQKKSTTSQESAEVKKTSTEQKQSIPEIETAKEQAASEPVINKQEEVITKQQPIQQTTDTIQSSITETEIDDTLIVSRITEEEDLRNKNTIIRDNIFPDGLYYGVQLGAFMYSIPESYFARLKLKNVMTKAGPNNTTYFIAGAWEYYKEADLLRKDLKYIGFVDATIVAFENGIQISLKEAKSKSKK